MFGQKKRVKGWSADRKILAVAAILLVVVTGVTAFASLGAMHVRMSESLGAALQSTLATRRELLRYLIEDAEREARLIALNPGVHRRMRAIAGRENLEADLAIQRSILSAYLELGFSAVALFDPDGREIVSVGKRATNPQLSVPLHTAFGSELLWDGQFLLKTRIEMTDTGGLVGAALVERVFPDINSVAQDPRYMGETGEVGLCGAAGERLRCFPQRLNQRVFDLPLRNVDDEPFPMGLALFQNQTGVMRTKDYRQREVLAAYAPVTDTGLGMVLKIDTDELYGPMRRQVLWGVLAAVVFIVLGLAMLRARLHPLARELEESEARFRAVTENAPALISYIDAEGRYQFNNRTYEKWLGAGRSNITGRKVKDLLDHAAYEAVRPHIERGLRGELANFETQLVHGGFSGHVQGTYAPDFDEHGAVRGVFGLLSDITRLKQAEAELTRLAHYDALTGAANRVLFQDRLLQARARARRAGSQLAVMYLDVDKFKQVNDALGHAAGDELLREFAARLTACVRESDTVARLGGDEFAVILEAVGGRDEAARVAHKVVEAMRVPVPFHGNHIAMTTSIGVALASHDPDPERLLREADRALYQAKEAGRNGYRLAP